MKEKVKEEDVRGFKFYGTIYTVLLVLFVLSAVPFVYFLDVIGMVILGILFLIILYFSIKVEKYKLDNNVQTYKEIIAFVNGERLDEMQKNREYGKRIYQKFFLTLGAALISFVVCLLLSAVIHHFGLA